MLHRRILAKARSGYRIASRRFGAGRFEQGEDKRQVWHFLYGGNYARKYLHMDALIWSFSLWPLHMSVFVAYSFSVTQILRSLLFDPETFPNHNCLRDTMYWSEKRIANGRFNHWGPHKYNHGSMWNHDTDRLP